MLRTIKDLIAGGLGRVAYFAVLTSRNQKIRVVSVDAADMLIAPVGFSRVYLDAHYISDVVGGLLRGRMVERRHHGFKVGTAT